MADQNYDNEYKQRVEEILKIESEINSSYNDRLSAAQRLQGVLADQEAAQNRLKRSLSQFSRDEARQNAKAARYSGEAEAARQKGLGGLAKQLQLKADLAGAAAKELSSALAQYEAEDKLRRQEEARLELNKSLEEKSKEQLKAIGKTVSTAIGLNKVLQALSLQALVTSLLEANSATYTLSKQFGTSLESARATREEYEEFAQTNNRIDFGRLVKAQQDLGKAIGQNVEYSKEMAQDFVEVTEYMGLSTQTAGKLAQIGTTLGKTSQEFREGIADSLIPLNKSLGLNTNIKQLYEDVGSLSATTVINLGRQGSEMAKVTQLAKRFGMEMQQIASFSQSLLNFESSITAELEAEVLTGKELNLEKARMAALRGDEVTLAKEMAQQVGSINEFEKMNVIQRESLAKAFGMNVESMSAMLIRQEAMNELGDKAKDATDAQLEAAKEIQRENKGSLASALEEVQKRESASKKFEDSMRKLKTILTDILSGLDKPLDDIAGVIKSMTESPLFKTLAKVGMGLAAAGGIAKLIGSVTGALRGTRLLPMYVRMAGMPGAAGQGRVGQMMSRNIPGGAKYGQAMRLSQAGKYGLSKGMGGAMGLRGALGGAGLGLAGMGVSYLGNKAEEAGKEDLGYALGVGGSALQGAGMGAMIGSIVPVIGTAVGGAIGGGIGALIGFFKEEKEDELRREKEKEEREAKKEEEFQNALKDLAMKEAKIYMDSNQVGLGLASGNNYAI
jgi:hypothetical protein